MADQFTQGEPERRVNLRLRRLIDDLQSGVLENRLSITALNSRVDQLTAAVERLQKTAAAP